jgi:hypothetical protein
LNFIEVLLLGIPKIAKNRMMKVEVTLPLSFGLFNLHAIGYASSLRSTGTTREIPFSTIVIP